VSQTIEFWMDQTELREAALKKAELRIEELEDELRAANANAEMMRLLGYIIGKRGER
jgi:hypothetical protein